jgi:glutathione S-transferase
MLQLYFGVGACSFVPHVALEAAKAQFEPKMVKLHKGENRAPEYLAMNPNAQVPVLLVDGKPLTQIIAICDYIDRAFPDYGFLPKDSFGKAKALSDLGWMNNTVHPTFTRVFFKDRYAKTEPAQAEVKQRAIEEYRGYLERLQGMSPKSGFWLGERVSFHDAYAFTLLRWGGFAGIDPNSLPALKAYVERVMQAPPVAAVMARERVALDTFKA